MDLLVTADWHVGKKTHGQRDPDTGLNTRLTDVRERLMEIARTSSRADLVLFGGDAFETPTPTPTQQRIVIDALNAMDAPVIMIPGNHDHPVTEGRSHALDGLRELSRVTVIDEPMAALANEHGVVNRIEDDDPAAVRQQTETVLDHAQGFILCALPWPLSQFGDGTEESVWARYMAATVRAHKAADTTGLPSIGLGHFTAEGSLPSGSEASLQMSRELTFSPKSLSAKLDFTALGHIHKHQDLTPDSPEEEDLPEGSLPEPKDSSPTEYGPVVYTSSVERLTFGEEDEPKGYITVSTSDPDDWAFHELSARPYTTVEHPDDPAGAIREMEGDLDGHVVRVRHQSDTPLDTSEIFDLLDNAHTVAEIQHTGNTEVATSGNDVPDYNGLSAQELAERWAERKDLSDERTERMLEQYDEIKQ